MVNPADFFLDVISNEVPCPSMKSFDAVRDLPIIWSALCEKRGVTKKMNLANVRSVRTPMMDAGAITPTPMAAATNNLLPRKVTTLTSHSSIELAALDSIQMQPSSLLTGGIESDDAGRDSTRLSSNRDAFTHVLCRVFDRFDTNHSGFLSLEQCRALVEPSLQSTGIEVTDENIAITISGMVSHDQTSSHVEGLSRNCFVERISGFRNRALAMRREEGDHALDDVVSAPLLGRVKNRRRNGCCLTLKHTLERNLRQLGRQTNALILDSLMVFVPSLVISFIFRSKWDLFQDAAIVVFLSFLVLASIQIVSTIRLLASERLLFFRERKRGLCVPAYFFSKDLISLVDIAIRASVFAGTIYSFLVPELGYFTLFILSFYVCYFAAGIGFLLAATLSPNAALIAGVIVPTTVGGMLSGIIPTVPKIFTYLSFLRYAQEWFTMAELQSIDKLNGFDPQNPEALSLTTMFLYSQPKPFGFSRLADYGGTVSIPAVALLLGGIALRLITMIALCVVNNDRVKFLSRRLLCCACRASNISESVQHLESQRDAEKLSVSELMDGVARASSRGHFDATTVFNSLATPPPNSAEHPSLNGSSSNELPRMRRQSSSAMELLSVAMESDAMQAVVANAAAAHKLLRFQLPADSYAGQQIRVQDPDNHGVLVNVTVPSGVAAGNFITVRAPIVATSSNNIHHV
jgi:hypothetical protein